MIPLELAHHVVYVLRNKKTKTWYTGFSHDLRKRLDEHAAGKKGYTRNRGPYELIYFEACRNEHDARAREKYLKTGMGKRYLKNRLKRLLALTG